jgi:hypothetical protein
VAAHPTTQIAASDLDMLGHLLDQVPVHRDTSVSKQRAIRILAPKLYAMRAKGYSWGDIAAWLMDHGLTAARGGASRLGAARSAGGRECRFGRCSPAADSCMRTPDEPFGVRLGRRLGTGRDAARNARGGATHPGDRRAPRRARRASFGVRRAAGLERHLSRAHRRPSLPSTERPMKC